MLALEIIAERRIEEAVARGELQGLPGEGQPLDLWEDPLVPEAMRMAKRILKNADLQPVDVLREMGYLPSGEKAVLRHSLVTTYRDPRTPR